MNTRTRRGAGAALALTLAAGLTSCSLAIPSLSADSEPAADATPAEAVDASLTVAEPDLSGSTQILTGAELEPVAASESHGVHAPGLAVDITETGTLTSISAEVYEDLTGFAPQPNEDGELPAEVRPADGHVFVAARYETSDPEWKPRDAEIRTTAVVRTPGSDGWELLDTQMDDARSMGTVVVSVPDDYEPSDAVIEIETDEAFQSVSLVDGTRVATDVPHAYPGQRVVTIENKQKLDASFEHWTSGPTTVQGEVTDAFSTPYLDAGYGQGDGWSAPDQVYLSVDVDWHLSATTTYDETAILLEGPEGEVFQPINDPKGLLDVFERAAVFQIPADLETATVVIESAYRNGVLSGAELIEFDPIRAELRIGSAGYGGRDD